MLDPLPDMEAEKMVDMLDKLRGRECVYKWSTTHKSQRETSSGKQETKESTSGVPRLKIKE